MGSFSADPAAAREAEVGDETLSDKVENSLPTPGLLLAEALRQAREEHGLSLRGLARRLHRSHSNLWDYERGHRVATREVVQDYERALRLPPHSLLNLWQAAEDAEREARNRRKSGQRDPALPSGTVTFLLTDIVGSTRIWEEHPLEMELALATHDKIMETAVTRAGGSLLKMRGEGDSSSVPSSTNDVHMRVVRDRCRDRCPRGPIGFVRGTRGERESA